MAVYDQHTEGVYGKLAALKITNALYSTRFCCICLGNSEKLLVLDTCKASDDDENSSLRSPSWRDMIEEVFGNTVVFILFSDHICSACVSSLQKAFIFIQQTKANARIFTEYFNTLHKLTMDLLHLNTVEDISKVVFNLSFNLNNFGNHEKEDCPDELKHTKKQNAEIRAEIEINELTEKETKFAYTQEVLKKSIEAKGNNKYEYDREVTEETEIMEKTKEAKKPEEINITEEIQMTKLSKEISNYTYEIEMTEVTQVTKESEKTEDTDEVRHIEKSKETKVTKEKEASEEIHFFTCNSSEASFSKETEVIMEKEIIQEIELPEVIEESKVTKEIEAFDGTEIIKQSEKRKLEMTMEIPVTLETQVTKEMKIFEKEDHLDELKHTKKQNAEIRAKIEIHEITEKEKETTFAYTKEVLKKSIEVKENNKYEYDREMTEETELIEKTKEAKKPEEINITDGIEMTKLSKEISKYKYTYEIEMTEVIQVTKESEKTEDTVEVRNIEKSKETEVTKEKEASEEIHFFTCNSSEASFSKETKVIMESNIIKESKKAMKTQLAKEKDVKDETQVTKQTEVTNETEIMEKPIQVKQGKQTKEIEILEEIKGTDKIDVLKETEEVEALDEIKIIETFEKTKLTEETTVLGESELIQEIEILDSETEIIEEIEILDSDTEITEELEEIKALEESNIMGVLKRIDLREEIEVLDETEEIEVFVDNHISEEIESLDTDTETTNETEKIDEGDLSATVVTQELEVSNEKENKMTELIKEQKKFYECGTCHRIYWLNSWFRLHLKTKGHIAKTKTCCPQCVNQPCKHEKYLLAYEQQKGNRRIECPVCKILFYSLNELLAHANKDHFRNRAVICDVCNKEFYLKSQLVTHLKQHNPKVKCWLCFRVFRSDVFKKHQSKCQHANKPVKCGECPALFINVEAYMDHKKEHTELDIQNMALVRKLANKDPENGKSRNTTGKTMRKVYDCPVCQYECRVRDRLSEHLNSMHPEETKRTCHVCVKIFNSRQQYLDHRKKKEHLQLNSKTPRRKHLYCCDYCDYSNKLKSHLAAHINRYHLKIMPYECFICNEKFLDQRSLNIHLKKHICKEKRVCNICGKVLDSSTMIKHMRKHKALTKLTRG